MDGATGPDNAAFSFRRMLIPPGPTRQVTRFDGVDPSAENPVEALLPEPGAQVGENLEAELLELAHALLLAEAALHSGNSTRGLAVAEIRWQRSRTAQEREVPSTPRQPGHVASGLRGGT